MMYDSFAEVYDELMDDFDYDSWSQYYLSLMHLAAGSRIAECGCGTGSLSVRFAQAGLSVVGVDSSPSMLRICDEKARKFGASVQLLCQDMRRLQLPRRIPCVTATCDAVNYLLTPSDVRAFFDAAYAALQPGGILVFDVSTPYKLLTVTGNAFFGEEREDIAYLWQNHKDDEKQLITMDITCFVREKDGRYRKFRETHRQRAHTAEELVRWLTEAGFEDIAVFGDRTMQQPEENEYRNHFRAVKHGGTNTNGRT